MSSIPDDDAPRGRKRPRRSVDDYTIACFCPMGVELAPLRAMLDSEHEGPAIGCNRNVYVFGELGPHNIVICVLPTTGTNDCAIAATQLKNDFPAVDYYLLVGIADGVPGPAGSCDVRLGDVVVSTPTGGTGGVIQFDRGKRRDGDVFEILGHLNKPSPALSAHVRSLESLHLQGRNMLEQYIDDMFRRHPDMKSTFSRPSQAEDKLFEVAYQHQSGPEDCDNCDIGRLVERPDHDNRRLRIHYGTIGSSNAVLRNAVEREKLRTQFGVLAVEMEAAALMDSFPCLVVRGICDYADGHKIKTWQPYAAVVAAAYTKALIQLVPPVTRLSVRSSTHLIGHNEADEVLRMGSDMSPTLVSKDKATDQHLSTTRPLPTTDPTADDDSLLIESLTFERMDARSRNITDPLTKTCTWLFGHPNFATWINRDETDDAHRGFLWIRGKPGSGKSTIMKTALLWVKKRRTRGIIVSYFFNARAPGDLEKSSLGMYRSLVYQILKLLPTLVPEFLTHFASKQRGDLYEEWTIEELQNFLLAVIRVQQVKPLNIFIDALDEGDDSDVRQMVSFLENLALCAIAHGSTLRICLSSRHYPSFQTQKSLSLIVEEEEGHKRDIETYINHKLVRFEDLDMQGLQARILRQSAGVFLWVVLVMPMLDTAYSTGHSSGVDRCLEHLPTEMDELFSNILTRSKELIQDCISLFQWVLFAGRALNPKELQCAIECNPTRTYEKRSSAPSDAATSRYLVHCSRGLVEITKSQPSTVQFIHETVREYLWKRGGLSKLLRDLGPNIEGISHDLLKQSCVHYLYQHSCHEKYSSEKGKRKTVLESCVGLDDDTFLKYVVEHMFRHASAAEKHKVSQAAFLATFTDAASTHLVRWVRVRNGFLTIKVRRYTSEVCLLYILAEQNAVDLVRALLSSNFKDERNKERCGTALQAACAAGHQEIVTMLIEAGSDVNVQGGEFGCPISAAIHGKHKAVIDTLVQNHVQAPRTDAMKRLVASCARGFNQGVQTLLQLGLDPNAQDVPRKGPLAAALRHGKDDVVEILLRYGASVDATKVDGEVMTSAARRCKAKTMHLLLDHGADINAQGGYWGNALQAAAHFDRPEVVQLLLDRGADVNVQGGHWGNALQAAADRGHLDTVQLLLDRGADVNAQNRDDGSALQAAASSGRLEMVQILLDHGPDPNTRDLMRESPLEAMCGRGLSRVTLEQRVKIVKLLINNGADLNPRMQGKDSPLRMATKAGRTEIVDLLSSLGARDYKVEYE